MPHARFPCNRRASPRTTARAWLACLALVINAAPALAHRQAGVVSTLVYTDQGELEITHRFHAHDALTLVPEGLEIESIEARARIALHAETHFRLRTDRASAPLAIETIGAEIIGDDVYVYQVIRMPSEPVSLMVNHRLLNSHATTPIHVVNVEIGDQVVSNKFMPADAWQTLLLP